MFDIAENLKKLPDTPGVYMHKDKLGQIIYVGKAISLKNRVRQYFQSTKTMDPKVKAMVSQIEEFEYITTASEMEALILECNLIKKHMPKYNVLLRDDKTYPYIKVTVLEDYPRLVKTRIVGKDGSKYFGPYSDVKAVNQIVELLGRVYALKKCSARVFPKGFRPCLNYHIKQCDGICQGNVDQEIYRKRVELAMDFLRGRTKGITQYLEDKMKKAAEAMDFEQAAEYRDYIQAAKSLSEMQRVVLQDRKDVDLVLPVRGEKQSYVVLFSVREGKLSGRETFDLQSMAEDKPEELVAAFIQQHYNENLHPPKEIILEKKLADQGLLEEYLADLASHQVKLLVPQKGEKRAILDLAKRDVIEMIKTIDQREEAKRERKMALGARIHYLLTRMGWEDGTYHGHEYRVEAYDISNTNGVDTVGAMVVFEGLKPDKKSYRRFKIRSVEGPNDYGSMQEVLFRRFKRAIEGDEKFSQYPELILIDGGKGHITAALEMIRAMELELPVVGMAKDDHHRSKSLIFFSEGEIEEIQLKDDPLLYKYIGTVQEEVHRFAIDYHRGLRGKNMLTSALDEIEGIGPAKRNALLTHFGSVDKIKEADVAELKKVKGVTEALANRIQKYFHC